MEQSRHKHILSSPPEPPEYLVAKILGALDREERTATVRRMAWSGGFLVISLGAAAASIVKMESDLSQSGFLSFLSLFSSDFSFAIAHFRDMAFSLAESFPGISAALAFASIGLVLWFGVRLAQEGALVRREHGMSRLFS
jgi:hypothetical protein